MATHPSPRALSAPEQERHAKRDKLMTEGRAYAQDARLTHTIQGVRDEWGAKLGPNETTTAVETIAGRVMFFRSSGKIAFATLQAGDGARLQLMLPAQDLGVEAARLDPTLTDATLDFDAECVRLGKAVIKDFDKTVDLGDFIEATGVVATSIKGELSLRVSSWRMLTKSVRPLPFLHADLSDEMRVRQPYAELIQSQDARDRVRARAKVVREVRRYFEDQGFIELETPVLQPIHGGALARPFKTHVNALGQEFSLRIALELNLKKAVVGGLDRVFELGRVFRNEGMDSTHSPEFTMLEAYEAYGDMHSMASSAEHILRRVCSQVAGTEASPYEFTLDSGQVLDFGSPFAWVSVYEGLSELLDAHVTPDTKLAGLRALALENGVKFEPQWSAGKLVMELCSELLEPTLVQPTFLFDWPAEAQPLAARNPEDDRRVLAWDLIINGVEYGTAFTELVDPVVQREILTEQSLQAACGDAEAMQLDEDFLRALEYGCPPMGGIGLGVDRLVMLFTRSNIRQAILFPLVRREEY